MKPWTEACQASLSCTVSWSLLKLMPIELVMPSNHCILCCSLLLLPSIFPSIRVFSNELVLCIRWPKYWVSASASVLPMNVQDWFPLGWTGWISLQSKGLLRVFSSTTVEKHQFFSAQPSLWSHSHICSSSSLVAKSCLTLATPWTIALQVPLSVGFSRQEYWSGLPYPSPGDLPDPGIKPRSPALQANSLPTEL